MEASFVWAPNKARGEGPETLQLPLDQSLHVVQVHLAVRLSAAEDVQHLAIAVSVKLQEGALAVFHCFQSAARPAHVRFCATAISLPPFISDTAAMQAG